MSAPEPKAPASDLDAAVWSALADLATIKGWLHGLSTCPDLSDVVADGGVTIGDCYQQEAREFAGRLGRVSAALSSQSQAAKGMAKALEASTTDLAYVDSSLTAMADGGHAPASGTWGLVLRRIDANRTALSHYRTLGDRHDD